MPRDIRWAKNEIFVAKGKGKKDRVVWTDATTMEILDRWRAIRPKSETFFSTLGGEKLSTSHIRHMMARRGLKAGIETRVHPHMLRHSFASELLEEGVSIREVQRLLGHEDLETTSIYLDIVDEDLRHKMLNRPG